MTAPDVPTEYEVPHPLPVLSGTPAPGYVVADAGKAVMFAALIVGASELAKSAFTSALKVGFAADPEAGPASTVFAVCVTGVAVTVPEVVTAVLGVAESMMPSPVKVTLVTVPEPPPPPEPICVHVQDPPLGLPGYHPVPLAKEYLHGREHAVDPDGSADTVTIDGLLT